MTPPACSCGRRHSPAPRGTDDHHVIPRAWQAAWRPDPLNAPPGTPSDVSLGLWDPETVELAPTCHRNVHVALAAMMRLAQRVGEELHPGAPTSAVVVERCAHLLAGRFGPEERIAVLAVHTWESHGGEVDFLLERKLYGIG